MTVTIEASFSRLNHGNYRVTSDPTDTYNCIAHAAGRGDAWWWPVDGVDGVVWPEGVARETTLDCFVAAYAAQGYERCQDAELEAGYEKVAIYADAHGEPQHAALQLPSGTWTSKLGESEDIEHDSLEAIEDVGGFGVYGNVAVLLKRPRP